MSVGRVEVYGIWGLGLGGLRAQGLGFGGLGGLGFRGFGFTVSAQVWSSYGCLTITSPTVLTTTYKRTVTIKIRAIESAFTQPAQAELTTPMIGFGSSHGRGVCSGRHRHRDGKFVVPERQRELPVQLPPRCRACTTEGNGPKMVTSD